MHHEPRISIAALVWILVGLGIGAGLINLLVTTGTHRHIQAVRIQTEQAQAELEDSIDVLLEQRAALERQIEHHTGPRSSAAREKEINDTRASIDTCKQNYRSLINSQAESVGLFDRLQADLLELQNVRDLAVDQTARVMFLKTQWRTAIYKVREEINKAISAADRAEGTQRLRQIAALRKYRQAQGQQAVVSADAIINNLDMNARPSAIKTELNELAVLAEQLIAATDVNTIRSLKENHLRQLLARLWHGAQKMPPAMASEFQDNVQQLQAVLFGESSYDDVYHHTMITGQGGLYDIQEENILAVNTLEAAKKLDTKR